MLIIVPMSYFNQYLNGATLKTSVKAAADRLSSVEFDSIICRGNSGLLFASALGMEMEKNILINRKRTDNSHSSNSVEGEKYGVRKILIVDDFISSGRTINEIHKCLQEDSSLRDAEYVGIYLYGRDFEEDRRCVIYNDFENVDSGVFKQVRVMTSDSETYSDIVEELCRA